MDQKLFQQIKGLGLQDNEAKIYLALLELGQGTVTQISQRAKLNRTTGYDVLERLGIYGLVHRSMSGKGKRVYAAESPTRLKQFLKQKKKQIEKNLEEIDSVLPDLQSLHKTQLKPIIKFAEGQKAMEELYLNMLDSKSAVYSILNLEGFADNFDEMGRSQSEERFKRGINQKVISLKSKDALTWYNKTYGGKKDRQKNTEYRWIDKDERYSTAGEVVIFDDKVIGILSQPEESVAFEIQGQTFADFLKIVFEMGRDKAGEKNE